MATIPYHCPECGWEGENPKDVEEWLTPGGRSWTVRVCPACGSEAKETPHPSPPEGG